MYNIEFKILFLRLKVVHRIAPDYICKLISFRVPIKYQLRAARKLLLMALRGKVLPTLRARALSSAASYLWNHHRACLTLDLSVIWKLTFSAELSVCCLSNVKFLSSRGNCKVFLILIPFKMIIILNELSHENIIDWQSLLTSSVGEYLCWPFVIISSNCFKEC